VRVTLDNAWLRDVGVELVDTPGTGDIHPQRGALVLDLLNCCDAAFVVVSAAMPLSLTESAFLEQEILKRNIANVVVVVSHLDQVAAKQRAGILEHVNDRVQRVDRAIEVLAAHGLEDSADSFALDTIRTRLEAIAAQATRSIWRQRMVARQIADFTRLLDEAGLAFSEPLPDAGTGGTAMRALDTIRVELQTRCHTVLQRVDELARQRTSEIADSLYTTLTASKDPKTWWHQEMPFQLRRHLAALGRVLSDEIIKRISQDREWLHGELHTRSIPEPMECLPRAIADIPLTPNLDLLDVGRLELFTHLGTSAMMIAGHVLIGPAAVAVANVINTLLGRVTFMERTVLAQRQKIGRHLDSAVDDVLRQYSRQVAARLSELYERLLRQAEALAEVRGHVTSAGRQSSPARTSVPLAQVAALRMEIETALTRHPTSWPAASEGG